MSKEEVQRWAREEWARLDAEKTEKAQLACTHARIGILRPGTNIVTCVDCKLEIDWRKDHSSLNEVTTS